MIIILVWLYKNRGYIMSVRKSFWDYFWVARFFFRAVGIIPISQSPSTWKSILTEFLAASPLLYGSYVLYQPMKYILLRSHNVDDLLEAMIVVAVTLGGQIRSFFIVINRRKITRLFSICEKLWDHNTHADHDVISTWTERARLFSTTYFCAAQISTTLFVLTSAIRQTSLAENSTIRYYPFGFEKENYTPSPQYEIKYALQVICGHVGMLFVSAADMVGTLLALYICGQLALIQSWLLNNSKEKLNAKSGKINEPFETALKKCLRRHQVVMDFCTELEEVVRYINLTQIVTGMYILGISGARLMKNLKSYRYFGTLLLSISGLFFSCWPADNLSSVSAEVAQAVYGVPWYHCSRHEKMAIAIIITRSQRLAKLTAGKFVALSLETFSSIVSSSISFCMVLCSF